MNILIYIFAAIGVLVTAFILLLVCSWIWIRAVTAAVLRQQSRKTPPLTPPQENIPAT